MQRAAFPVLEAILSARGSGWRVATQSIENCQYKEKPVIADLRGSCCLTNASRALKSSFFVLQVRVPLFAVVYQSVYKNTCISVPRIHFLLYTRWYVPKKRSTQNCTRSTRLYIFWWCTENIGTFLYIFSTPDVILVHVPVLFSTRNMYTDVYSNTYWDELRTKDMYQEFCQCTKNFVMYKEKEGSIWQKVHIVLSQN